MCTTCINGATCLSCLGTNSAYRDYTSVCTCFPNTTLVNGMCTPCNSFNAQTVKQVK